MSYDWVDTIDEIEDLEWEIRLDVIKTFVTIGLAIVSVGILIYVLYTNIV